jgi:hypothetical protein
MALFILPLLPLAITGLVKVVGLARKQGDEDLNAVQDNVEEYSQKLGKVPILNGRLAKDVTVLADLAEVEVEHKLGRKPQGWVVVKRGLLNPSTPPNDRPIFENAQAVNKDKILTIFTTGDGCYLDLWIF